MKNKAMIKLGLAGLDLLEGVVEDFGDYAGEKWATYFKAGVCVYLDQIQPEIFVNHEIIAKQL